MSLTGKKPQVFLSHSGIDAPRAIELAARLEGELSNRGIQVEVFNTSEPEHRYKDLHELVTVGENFAVRAQQYEEELRAYLAENMEGSAAFVSLVTPASLEAASKIVEFEIETAHSLAKGRRIPFFFPCVAAGARLRDLPRGAMEFQGIALDTEEGLRRLADAIHRALSTDVAG